MKWTITATKNEEAWLSDYIADVVTNPPPKFPPHDQRIGSVEVHWHQEAPGLVYLAADPEQGTVDDRLLAQRIVWSQLQPFGFKRVTFNKQGAAWGVSPQVEQSAKRLVQSGAVHLDRNGQNAVLATVQGDGTDNDGEADQHKVELQFQDPSNPMQVTGCFCDCTWGQFMNTPRTRQWKRFQPNGRPIPCKHVIATYWVSRSVPQDEDRAPGNQGDEGQMSLFDMSGGQAPGSMGLMRQPPVPGAPGGGPMQNMQAQPQGLNDQSQWPPPPEDVLPQFPMGDMQEPMLPQVNPASVPGGRPGPTPTNPLQYPGGTFSHVAAQQFVNGDTVRLKNETVGQYVGRPESGMPGTSVTIQKGQSGHVRGTDLTTGMVEVLFMGDQFNPMGQLQPFGATAWCWASELQVIPPNAPGSNLKRLW